MSHYRGRRVFRQGRGWVLMYVIMTLVVTDLRGRRRVSKTDIAGVAEAKGVPASLQLTGGRWMKLPLVGDNLGNSVRAWLKDTSTGAVATPP